MIRRQRPAPHPTLPAVILPPVPGHGAGRGRRAGLRAAVVMGAVLAVSGVAAPAVAHDELTGATPTDGASVEIAPAAVELTFAEPPLALGSQVQVTGPGGEVVNAGDLQITDTVVSQPLAADLPAGDYTVAWRVTSSDGHPISGELAFTALAGPTDEQEPAIPEPVPTPSATAAEPAPAATPGPTASAGDDVVVPDAGAAVEDPATGAVPWVVGAAIVLLVGGTLWWVTRRRGTPQG